MDENGDAYSTISATQNITDELLNLVGDSLVHAIRFSFNENFRQSCLHVLKVKNSREAEVAIKTHLNMLWRYEKSENIPKPDLEQNPNTKLIHMINDLDDWV